MEHLPAYEELTLPTDGALRLRPWRPGDADAVFAACSDLTTSRWISVFRDYTRARADAMVLGAASTWAARRHLRLCLTDESDAVLGSADIDDLRPEHRSGDLGWWVRPDLRGRGLGTRAARLLVGLGLETLGLHRVTASIAAGNGASRWTAARAGLHLESTAREAGATLDGQRYDWETWRLLAGEEPLSPHPELSTPRLVLRAWRPADLEAVHAGGQEERVQRFTTKPWPYTVSDARLLVERTGLSTWAAGTGVSFAVTSPDSGQVLGGMGAGRREDLWEVGWWVAGEHGGQGVATEAAQAMLHWLVTETDVQVVEWRGLVSNDASWRVAQKLGFVEEGVLRSRFAKDRSHDDRIASLLRSEIPLRTPGGCPSNR